MSRVIFQISTLCVVVASLCGCPLLNPFLAAPESAFEGAPTTGEAPLTVLFVDASETGTTNITDWQWDFGDGSTSTLRNPSHIYESPGLFTVSLTVTTSVGTHTALRADFVNVVQPPVAEFEATPVLGNSPLSVTFTDTSDQGSAEIIDWQWNFGDRTPTSAAQNPVHVYDEPGLYTVSLTVTSSVGSDTMEKVQFINVVGNPSADFTSDFAPGTAPLTVTFTDTSDAGTAAITAWTWDFGDGEMAMDQNPTHVYATPGIYTVTLTIETEVGEDTVVQENLITVDEGPVAAFSGEPVMGSAPLSVVFTDESSAGSMAISRRLWDFGDGGLLSTLQNPTRIYNVPGLYTVSLQVTSPVGSNTLEQADLVTVLPGVSFTANQTSGTGSLTVQFVDQSFVGDFEVSAWTWDFGDGGMSMEQNPEHTFAEPGVYDVSMTLSTDLGDSTATQAGFIVVAPATDFSADPTVGPPPLEVTFTDETAAGSFEVSAWAWEFGDGETSEEEAPVHTYATPGIYSVSLETTTDNGVSRADKPALIAVEPIVTFGADTTSGQGTLTVSFEDQTDAGNLNVLAWFWNFGDGMNSTEQNPTHTYQSIGTYDVSLRVTTAIGDSTATEEGFINVGPIVDFSSDTQSGVGVLMVTFTDLTDAGALEIEGWMWEFGDGMVTDEQNPVHEYALPGIYSVMLTVTTSQGDTATAKADLIVVEPQVAIDFVQSEGPAPFEASLLDVTLPLPDGNPFKPTAWEWNLGDGNTSTDQNPVHVYVDPGTYTVSLTITTAGGNFSATEQDFIRALRGPTAAFTESISAGSDPDDPVDVSFMNMSLPGDSPILNQTWDFGESAIFAEEDTMEENPSVTYPGAAFLGTPQDVSLTVRTFLGEDVLLKENIFGAKMRSAKLNAKSLWASDLYLLATDGTGDVWAAGRLGHRQNEPNGVALVRLSPAGNQRWGLGLEADVSLTAEGLCVTPEGAVLLAGTLHHDDGKTVYVASYDSSGELTWERHLQFAAPVQSAAIALDGGGGFLLACLAGGDPSIGRLIFVDGGLDGKSIALHESEHVVHRGILSLSVLGDESALLTADGLGALGVQLDSDQKASVSPWVAKGAVLESGKTLATAWDRESGELHRSIGRAGELCFAPEFEAVIRLGQPAEVPHAIEVDTGTREPSIVWLVRDGESRTWTVGRLGNGPR
jgi:PKD repeat protein